MVERTSTRWSILPFLLKEISHPSSTTSVVILYTMRAPMRVIDSHRVCFIFRKGTVGSILVFSQDLASPCCGFLIVAMLILRTPPRTPKLCPNRLPQSGASPSRSLLGINDLPSSTAIISGSLNLSVADARPYQFHQLAELFGYCPVRQGLTYAVSPS